MYPTLRLYEDVLANGAEASWPALPRMIFVVHGAVTIADRTLHDEDTFGSEAPVTLKAGSGGATLWRWELAPDGATAAANSGGGIRTREKLAARLETAPKGPLLLRGDGVAFPPGGCAYQHRHQGPGSAASSKAAFVSTPTAARRHTARAGHGTRPAPTAFSRKARTARRGSFAS